MDIIRTQSYFTETSITKLNVTSLTEEDNSMTYSIRIIISEGNALLALQTGDSVTHSAAVEENIFQSCNSSHSANTPLTDKCRSVAV